MMAFRKICSAIAAIALALAPMAAEAQYQPFGPSFPKNLIDNPKFDIYQRLVTAVAISSSTTATYHADRWAGYTSSSSQVLTLTNITSALPPSNPNGATPAFANAEQVGRTSGSNTTQVCLQQEIPTSDVTPYQGQAVSLSFWALAGAGLATGDATANTITATLGTGTGSDEGLSVLNGTAGTLNSFAGAANPLNTAQLISTTWTRYTFPAITIPATATEAAVQFCYTPTGTKATNEFFQVTGVQLEVAPQASAFEVRPTGYELGRVERYAYDIQEGTLTAGTVMIGSGEAPLTTTCLVPVIFPVTMRKAPTYTNALSATTLKIASAAVVNALATPFSATTGVNTTNSASITFTTTGLTAGNGCAPVSAAGSGALLFTADF